MGTSAPRRTWSGLTRRLGMAAAWLARVIRAGPPRPAAAPSVDWRRLQELFTEVLELRAEQRPAYLERAAAGDPELQRELESLIAAHEQPSILDRPPPVLVRCPPDPEESPPPSLTRTAPHYEVRGKVGSGSMGVVYRARDRRLGREVALKFLPPRLGADAYWNERFLAEARAAAALDHPNICTIYETGESDDGQLFLAMPFYEGDTLNRRLEGGPLEVAEALEVAAQVAAGLAKAHECGIVHRDIKPANIMITADGVVKIVDFGVAKLLDVAVTWPGVAIGTVAYMSPEQAQGEEIDGRTDLWSLGIVLYEMLTGERPFRGHHDRVLLNAIATKEPTRLTLLRPAIPQAVEEVVLRLLAKRRADRYATARELSAALDALRAAGRAAVTGEASSAGVPAVGERRHVTIVASMLSGYDGLIEQLVPDELERVVSGLRREAEAVAGRHGGVLNQFAGDQLVLLFGVPVTREDDAVRAARAALDFHARVSGLSAELQLSAAAPLAVHSGLDTGLVVTQATDDRARVFRVSGSAAHSAARLAEQAGAGEIWVSTESRNLVARYFELEARDALTLRGREHPLVPYRLLRETGVQTRFEAAERAGLTAFTGRDGELGTLRGCLDEMQGGAGQLVLVTGDAGLGKSRLLHEFRHRLANPDTPVLVGRCQSYGGGVPYLPFVDILRNGIGIGAADVDDATARIRSISPSLEEFIPLYLNLLSIRSTSFPVPWHLQGEAFRLAMQDALATILTLKAQRQPTVVLLEDWHWADEASQAVLRQLAEVLSGYPLCVLVTARPGYGVDWETPDQVTRIALKPLGQGSTEVMVRAILGVQEVPDELVRLIHERTGGNPFFIEEVCHALLEEGSLTIDDGGVRPSAPVQLLELPDSIQGVIRARLDRLPPDARDLLRLAAVTGRDFHKAVLEAASADRSALPQALESLKAAGLIQQTRPAPAAVYRFKHVLTQEVAYASLLEHQRRDLHGRVGAIIEQLYGERTDDQLDRLAHHFSRAESWPKAVQYGLRSAERANRLAQYAEALQILERTQRWIGRLPAGPERDAALIDTLLQQERLCETLGHRARQQQLIDEIIALVSDSEDHSRLADAYLRQGDLFTLLGRFSEAEESLQRSLRLRLELGDRVGERNTLRSLGLLRWHEGRNREALEIAEQTLQIARERDDLAAIVGDLTNCGAILHALGEHERARQVLEEALVVGEPADADAAAPGDELTVKRVYALQNLGNIYRELGDRAKGLECLHRAGAIAERKRLPIALAYHHTSLAHVHLQEGRIEESLSLYREAIDLTRKARYASGLAQSLRICGEVLVGLARHQDALPYLQEAAATFAGLGDVEGQGRMWSAIAAEEELLQHHVAAVAAWGKASLLLRQLGDGAGELAAVEGLARTTRVHVAEPSLALAHYQRGVRLAESLGADAAEGRMRNVMGILEWNRGEYAQALEHYERAHALFSGLGDEANAGLMLNSIGATLKVLGRTAEAEQRLREALQLHQRTGEVQLEGHALALIGDLLLDREDGEAAVGYYTRSLEIRRATGDRRGEGWMLQRVARCELARGAPYWVREHLTAAANIAEECGDTELGVACEQLRRLADE